MEGHANLKFVEYEKRIEELQADCRKSREAKGRLQAKHREVLLKDEQQEISFNEMQSRISFLERKWMKYKKKLMKLSSSDSRNKLCAHKYCSEKETQKLYKYNGTKETEELLEYEIIPQKLVKSDAHCSEVWSVEWNRTGTALASSGDDGTVRIWKRSEKDGPWCFAECQASPSSAASLVTVSSKE